MSNKLRTYCQGKYVQSGNRKDPLLDAYQRYMVDNTKYNHGKILTEVVLWYIIYFTMRHKKPDTDTKTEALRLHQALHPHPQSVQDEGFQNEEFLDPRDTVQVKYEMLRRHRIEGQSIQQAADSFGFSRQTFYLVEKAFDREGLPGLVPSRRGPKQAHKCTDEVLDFAEQCRRTSTDQSLSEAIEKRFGVRIHPRSIDRALTRRKKKPVRRKPRR